MAENMTPKKCLNFEKWDFATKQRMFGVLAIVDILCYRGLSIPEPRTLSNPGIEKKRNIKKYHTNKN